MFGDKNLLEEIKPEYVALAALPIIFWFVYSVTDASNPYKQNEERLNLRIQDEYRDVVIEKGRMKNNRNMPYLKRLKSEIYYEDELIWSKIEVGDSLFKIKGSPILTIKKKDTVILSDYNYVYSYWDSIYRSEAKK